MTLSPPPGGRQRTRPWRLRVCPAPRLTRRPLLLCADFSISAAGCAGTSGVFLNYTIGVEYPLTFWEMFTAKDTKIGKYLDPSLKRKMVVSNYTTLDARDPEFSLATLAAMAGQGVVCGAAPPLVGAPPVDCAQNVSGLLAETGTDIMFKIKGIEGGHHPENAGMAFEMSATVSLLSQKNSKICASEDPFCCANGDKDGFECCCKPDSMNAFCGSDLQTFVSDKCTGATGQTKQCSDYSCPVVNEKGDCSKHPELFQSDCAAFKHAVYNFTKGLPTGGARVDVFPSDPTAEPTEFDVLEYFFAELCVKGSDCPGLNHGEQWMSGDKTGSGKTPGLVKIGADKKTGDIGTCDSVLNRLYRKVGVWGIIGLVLLIIVLVAGAGFGGYTLYKKNKEKKMFPSLDVGINDPGAGTSADFNYADIDSVVS